MKGDTGRARPGSNAISYHGGPVMGSTAVNVHYIWCVESSVALYRQDLPHGIALLPDRHQEEFKLTHTFCASVVSFSGLMMQVRRLGGC